MIQHRHPSPVIVFDFGGVLLDWNPHYLYRKFFNNDPAATDRFLAEIGLVEWNNRQDAGRPLALAVQELAAQFPQHAALIHAFDERWVEMIGGAIQPTVEVLGALKQADYPLYALSNWSAETFARIRHRYDFLAWFDGIVLSGEVKLVKPDPRIYRLLLERIGRPAQDCLFIDDSAANIAAARELGFQTIRFESAAQLQKELLHLGLI